MARRAHEAATLQPMTTRSLRVALCLVLLVVAGSASRRAETTAAAPTTFYVDGKHGNDDNSGLSWSEAFKTINHAARAIPRGNVAGWTVVVRGYTDHVYRERPVPGGYGRWGSAAAPLVFMAEGWAPGSDAYVKPIVSGGLVAPRAGRSWQADSERGVWHTTWSSAPAGFDRAKPYSSAIFQNQTVTLWQHASLADLRARAGRGDGGYWYDKGASRLYVATKDGVSPGNQTIEVPSMMGFYFSGKDGTQYVSVRGFVVQHTKLGIAFHLGADYNTALDNVARANTPMGFTTSGRVKPDGTADPATGNVFERNSASFNTLQGFKIDAGSRDTRICDSTARRNAVQGIKVQGPPKGSTDPRVTSGTEICSSLLVGQSVRRPGPGRQDEQPNGLTIANGARGTSVHHNTIRDNLVGVMMNQGYRGNPIANTRFSRNLVAGNRVGLNLRDGVNDPRLGSGSLLASHNVYAGNGVGIQVAAGSSNKVFEHETVYDSDGAGWQIGCGCSYRARVTIRDSLATHNGGYGIAVSSGQDVTVSHVGLASNRRGPLSGPAQKTAVNTRSPGYMSRDPGHVDFLRISPTSYQYTAGPNGTPIGARY